MMMNGKNEYDVAIVGTGISGTIIGAILARHKFRVIMFDSEAHPRFAVGESTVGRTSAMIALMAERYDVPELKHLGTLRGLLDNVSSGCGVKRAVSFVYHRSGEQRAEECNQFVIPPLFHGPEMHLFRQDVDAYMLAVCGKYGATIHQQTRLKAFELSDSGARLEDDRGREYKARYLIDCSGHRSPVATQLGLRENPSRLKHNSRSLFTHMVNVKPYDDVVRPAGKHKMPIPWFQSTLHHVLPGGWVWVIPFNNHRRTTNPLCSVGLTLDQRRFPRPNKPPEEDFRGFIADYPSVVEQFDGANTIRPWISTDRVQYSSTRAVGPRYCLMAHSYGFIDPLFSRGLAATMDLINSFAYRLMQALRDDDFSDERFKYVEQLSRGLLDYTDTLVRCAYTGFSHYPLFNAWIRVWAIGEAGLDFLRLLRVQLRFRETGDASIFESLDDVPYPGLICPNQEDYRRLFDDSSADIDAVEAGKLSAEVAAANIFKRIKDANLITPSIKLHDPDSRLVPGDIITNLKAFAWGKFSAPPDLRKRFYDMKLSSMLKHATQNLRELVESY